MNQIIKTLLDQDLYKITMQQAVLHQFPDTQVRYKFACRTPNIGFSIPDAHKIRDEIDGLGNLSFNDDELAWLGKLRFIKKDYVDFLRLVRLDPNYVKVQVDPFRITIEGPWLHTILFEVPILAIVNEVFFQNAEGHVKEGLSRLAAKMEMLKAAPANFKMAEFGTRRRFGRAWQDIVVQHLAKSNHLTGTSNMMLAKKYDLTPIGTMAHEFLMAGQAFVRISESQKYMLEAWVKEYRGDLGIALTDTIGIDAFLRDFDSYFAKLYDGVRQDSGDPFDFGEKVIKHYQKMRIDPRTKRAVFTDGLDIPTALSLHEKFGSRIDTSFGIGTNLTNNLGPAPINIVVKMVECNGQPVAKISDSPGKQMCEDEEYVNYLKKVFGIEK